MSVNSFDEDSDEDFATERPLSVYGVHRKFRNVSLIKLRNTSHRAHRRSHPEIKLILKDIAIKENPCDVTGAASQVKIEKISIET